MRLPHIRRTAPDVLATAKTQRGGPTEVLRVLLTEEVARRDRSSLVTHRACAPTSHGGARRGDAADDGGRSSGCI